MITFVNMYELENNTTLESITERIFQFTAKQMLNDAKFAASINVNASTISHLRSGRNKVSLDVCIKIIDAFPILSPDWLLLGEGNMLKDNGIEEKPKDLFTSVLTTDNIKANEEALPSNSIFKEKKDINISQEAVKQEAKRFVKKIVVLYNDGSFKEFTS